MASLATKYRKTNFLKPMHDLVITQTRHWLERVVIGLNLCPFAKAPLAKDLVRFVVSDATSPDELLQDLANELEYLAERTPKTLETTLLIHPQVLTEFDDYNQFLDIADMAIEQLGHEGVIQVASFHPNYQFAETEPDAPENFSNRSPYPMLHLLREESVELATESGQSAEQIVQRNVTLLKGMGVEALLKLTKQG
jgi:uncharacterized protein